MISLWVILKYFRYGLTATPPSHDFIKLLFLIHNETSYKLLAVGELSVNPHPVGSL